jgi:hypothetical protein
MYLTKSDYRIARSCAAKLYHRRTGALPAADDAYLRLLAEGGFMVEEIARQLHPGGRLVGFHGTPEQAAERTRREIEGGDCVLFEATLIAGALLARIDVLVVRGGEVELVEVKSASFPGDEHRARLAEGLPGVMRGKRPPHPLVDKWPPYVEDVAFQLLVARRALPGRDVRPFLMMPDRSLRTDVDGLWRWFRLERGGAGSPAVAFTGDAEALRRAPFLAKVDVSEEVALVLGEVEAAAAEFAASVVPEPRPIPVPVSMRCRECELHAGDHLFPGCWGELAEVRPNLFELYSVGTIGGTRDPLADRLIRERRIHLFDVQESDLVRADGTVGATNVRQLVQLRNTRMNREWVSDGFPAVLDSLAYPLHFIDFETSALAIPYHAGMRPYEPVAYQWSCHTVPHAGAEPVHLEWINATDVLPNREFVETLRAALGSEGTAFMWATHERSTLRRIRAQLAERGEADPALAAWVEALEGRLVDMERLTFEHYFHPRMGGRTSIKQVVQAVWGENPRVRAAFPEYDGAEGASLYAALPPVEIGGVSFEVREGTAAVRAYQAMMYGAESRDPASREALRALLLRYCRLDTAAMVMVWMHWRGRRAPTP